MADYESAFPTSLGDYCTVHGIQRSQLEIKAILAVGDYQGFNRQGAYQRAVLEFNKLAESYDDVVEVREGITQRFTGATFLFGFADSTYYIRGTALKKKDK